MSAIVNATPLIALAVVNRLDLLSQIFGEVIVPTAVYQEVVSTEMDRPGAQIITQAKWLKVISPQAVPTFANIVRIRCRRDRSIAFSARAATGLGYH